MKNWLIKLLGGYTEEEYWDMHVKNFNLEVQIAALESDLKQARKNDTPKDPKTGRFIKKK